MIEPILADIEWVKVIVFIIFVLGPLLGQLGKGKGKANANAPKGPRAPVPGPLPPRKALDDEIAEFLKQAQQNANRPQQPPQQPPRPRPQAPRPGGEPVKPQTIGPQRRPAEGKEKNVFKPPKKQTVKPAGTPQRRPLREEVGEHVTRHIDTSSIRQHSEGLGGRVRDADEQVEQHLHNVFDHRLGELDTGSHKNVIREGTDDAAWNELGEEQKRMQQQRILQVNDITRMLRDPIAIREAIVLGELLGPPVSERVVP